MAATVVFNKQKGRWQVIYRQPGGKRTAFLCASEEEAREAARLRNEKDRGLHEARQNVRAGSLLGGDLVCAWLEATKAGRRPSTMITYRGLVEGHIVPFFEKKDMRNFTRHDAKNFGAHLATPKSEGGKGLAYGSCETPLSIVRSALIWAADEKLISKDDVIRGIVKHGLDGARARVPVEKAEKDTVAWSEKERDLLLEIASTNAHGYAVLFTALESGMRSGELYALCWKHIDFHGKTIHIEQSLSRRRSGSKRSIQQTKTGKVRTIAMSDELAEFLRERHRERMRKNAFDRGLAEAPVLLNSHGQRWNERSFDDVWNRIRDRAHAAHGVRPLKLHATRSTFATLALMNRADPALVAHQLGDRLTTVYEHYAAFIRDQDTSRLFPSRAPAGAAARESVDAG